MTDADYLAAACALKAVADPTRFRMVCQLFDHPKGVNNLGTEVGIDEEKSVHHLRILRAAGLVLRERHGAFVFQRLDERGLRRSSTGPSLALPGGYRLHFEIGNQPRPNSYPLHSVTHGRGVGAIQENGDG